MKRHSSPTDESEEDDFHPPPSKKRAKARPRTAKSPSATNGVSQARQVASPAVARVKACDVVGSPAKARKPAAKTKGMYMIIDMKNWKDSVGNSVPTTHKIQNSRHFPDISYQFSGLNSGLRQGFNMALLPASISTI